MRNRTPELCSRMSAIATLVTIAIAVTSAPVLAQGKPAPAKAKKMQRVTRVVIDTVRREPMRQTIPILGRFVARQTGPVAARVAGSIGEFRVDVGDRVNQGDVVAVLVKERLVWQHNLQKAEVAHFTAQVRTKKREIKLLQQELDRLKSLRQSPAFSQARLDDKIQQVSVAESTVAEADARLRMANANLRLTAISLHDAEVKAPYAGIVLKKHTEVGAYVGVGAPLVSIIDDQSMEIEADIPAFRLSGLSSNTIVSAELENRTRIDATLRAIIPEENPRTRTRAVRFIPAFGDTITSIASNQSITLFIPAGPVRNAATVHKDALLIKKGKRAVFLAQDGKAFIRYVSLGEATGSRFSVTSGLKSGDMVVIRGNERLRPGALIAFDTPLDAGDKDQSTPVNSKQSGNKSGKDQ